MSSAAGTQQAPIDSAIAAGGRRSESGGASIRAWIERPTSIALLSLVGAVFAASVLLGLISGAGPAAHLGEWSAVTFLSAALLITCAGLLLLTFRRRGKEKGSRRVARWFAPRMVWAVMALGFLFLATDELYEFHERFDLLIHTALAIEETPLSDRIDDGIVLLYGLLGLAVLRRGRFELRLFRSAWPPLGLAFILLFAMVALDLLTNRWFAPRGVDPDSAAIKLLAGWGIVAEELLKLLSGTMFVIAFAAMARQARDWPMPPGAGNRLNHQVSAHAPFGAEPPRCLLGPPTPSHPSHRGR